MSLRSLVPLVPLVALVSETPAPSFTRITGDLPPTAVYPPKLRLSGAKKDQPLHIKGIIFDLDDTLLLEVPSAEAAFVETCQLAEEKHGVDPFALQQAVRERAKPIWYSAPERAFCVAVGVSSWEALWARFDGDHPSLAVLREWIPTYRRRVWTSGLAAFDIRDDEPAAAMDEAFPVNRRKRHRLFDDTLPVLDGLAGRWPLGLITNGLSCLQREKIAGAGIGKYFQAVTISGDLGVGKPDPAPFRHLLAEMGLEAHTTLMVGNGLRTDIKGAAAAGMITVLVERGDPHGDDEAVTPDFTIPNLLAFEPLLGRLGVSPPSDVPRSARLAR